MRWIGLSTGLLGSLGGFALSVYGLHGLSYPGEPFLGFVSEPGAKTFLGAMIALFVVGVFATVSSLKAPRIAGMILIAIGGVVVIASVLGTALLFYAGLFLIPFGFLVLVAGALATTSAESAHRTRQGTAGER